MIAPVPVFQIQQLKPEPRVAAAVNETVNVLAVQLITVPASPATTVYAAVLLLRVSVDEPPPLAAIVIVPLPLVMVTFDPAVRVDRVNPVPLPISS